MFVGWRCKNKVVSFTWLDLTFAFFGVMVNLHKSGKQKTVQIKQNVEIDNQ